MIDGIKLFLIITDEEVNHLKSIIDFTSKVSIETGLVVGTTQIGYHRGLKFTLRKEFALTIQGSIHKAFSKGVNYNIFSYSCCTKAMDLFIKEIGINSKRLKIQNIEFGVNIYEPKISFTTIENNLLLHKLTQFNTYVKQNKTFGFECKHQQYSLKIYDKSLQENLTENILRLEYKVTNMEILKSIGIKCFLDLNDVAKLDKVGKKIAVELTHILMDNCDVLESEELPKNDESFYYKACNVRYWKKLSKISLSTYTSHRRRFKRIIVKYSQEDLSETISKIFIENWQKLLSK